MPDLAVKTMKDLPPSPWGERKRGGRPKGYKLSTTTKNKIRRARLRIKLPYEKFCQLIESGEVGRRMQFYVNKYPDWVKKAICEDIIFLARDVLGYKWDGREGLNNPPDLVHEDMREFFDRPERYKLGEYPRGTYKSTLIAICRPIQWKCRDFEDTVGIIGETWALARKRLAAIQAHLELNPYLKQLYGEWVPTKTKSGSNWNRDFIYIKQRKSLVQLTEPCISTAGLDSKTTGWHPRHLVVDDPASDDNTTTPEQIQKVAGYLDGYIDLAGTSGDITILATPRKPDDQLSIIKENWGKVKDEETGRPIFAFRNMSVWNNDTEDDLIMPRKYTKKAIITLRNLKTVKTFATQYLCDPCAGGNTLIKKEDLDATEYFIHLADQWKNNKDQWWAYVAVDPGRSLQPRKCYTGVVVGIPVMPYDLYFDEALRLKLEPSAIIEAILALVMQPHYYLHIRMIGVEINAFQQIYEGSLLNALSKLAEKLKAEGNDEAARYLSHIIVFPIESTQNKDDRIYGMEPYYRSRQIHVRIGSQGLKFLRHQIGSYPNLSINNRDLVDATTFFRDMLPSWLVNPYGIIDVNLKPSAKKKVSRPWCFPRKAGDEDYFNRGERCY